MTRAATILLGAGGLLAALGACAPAKLPAPVEKAEAALRTDSLPIVRVADRCAATPGSRFDLQVPRNGTHDAALLDRAVLHEVNRVRCRRGLVPLRPDAKLREAAIGHARDMGERAFFSHTSPVRGKRTLRQRLQKVGITRGRIAENLIEANFVAYENGTKYRVVNEERCKFRDHRGKIIPRHTYASLAKEFVNRWMESPGHRRNLLKPKLRRHGAGMAPNQVDELCGGLYAAQVLAG